jgi:hypothetical protein
MDIQSSKIDNKNTLLRWKRASREKLLYQNRLQDTENFRNSPVLHSISSDFDCKSSDGKEVSRVSI